MNRNKALLVVALFAAALFVYFWSRTGDRLSTSQAAKSKASSEQSKSGVPQPQLRPASPPPRADDSQKPRRKEVVDKILGVLGTPITFYGKVIDQNGKPVSSASVEYSAIDKFDADSSKYHGTSDANGSFSIENIKGAALAVAVKKKGYYPVPGKSYLTFAYGVGPDSTRLAPPTEEHPAVFILEKMGQAEPMIRISTGQIDIPVTGEPIRIDLSTGKRGQGDLQIESWLGDWTKKPFSWTYRFSVIGGGGLVERHGRFDFEAPPDGYQSAMEVSMPSDAKGWHSSIEKNYFVQFPDGRYARFEVDVYVGRRNFVVIEGYLNPNTGSRNLEYDPAKRVSQ